MLPKKDPSNLESYLTELDLISFMIIASFSGAVNLATGAVGLEIIVSIVICMSLV